MPQDRVLFTDNLLSKKSCLPRSTTSPLGGSPKGKPRLKFPVHSSGTIKNRNTKVLTLLRASIYVNLTFRVK